MESVEVLLVGNSYTYFNDMYRMLEAMLNESRSASVVQVTTGGMDLVGHYGHANTPHDHSLERKYLVDNPKTWAWVVLQDQSQTPGFFASKNLEEDFEDSMYAAKGLNRLVEATGADTIFYETWGDMDGSTYHETKDIFPDYPTMQKYLSEGYQRYQNFTSTPERPVAIAPVGTCFRVIYETLISQGLDPLAEDCMFRRLYFRDHKHPSPTGSFLAASVLYSTMTGDDVRELTYRPDKVDPSLADTMLAVAAHVVLKVPLIFPHQGESNTALDVSDHDSVQRRPLPND